MRRRLLDHTYKKTVTGNPAVAKSAARMYPDISFPGFTTQDGTPSPENPVDIVNAQSPVQVDAMGTNLFPFCKYFSQWTKRVNDSYFGENIYTDYAVTTTALKPYAKLVSPIFVLKPNKKYTVFGHVKTDNISEQSQYLGLRIMKNLDVADAKKTIATAKIKLGVTDKQIISDTFSTDNMDDTQECYCQLDCSWNHTVFPVVTTFSDIMICEGETTLPWEPYKNQSVTITSDRPITKWDKLIKQNGIWGWMYQTAYIESYSGEEITGEWQSTTGELSTGASVQYKTSPEFVPLPQEQQEALNALHTNNPTTIVQNSIGTDVTLTYKTKRSLEVNA